METAEKEKVKKVKQKVNALRIEESAELSTVDKMGEVTKAIIPEDIETMYAGKMCNELLGQKVAALNIMWGYVRDYCDLSDEAYKKLRESKSPLKDLAEILGAEHPFITICQNLMEMQKGMDDGFKIFKAKAEKVAGKHPLCKRFEGVRGISAYQIALIMSQVKDIARFNKPDSFCMWAGVASVRDNETGQVFAVTKGNIKHIQAIWAKQGKEYKGFDTVVAGRMTVVFDCLVRSRGFFFNYYQQIRERLMQRAINNNECFEPTPEQTKESKGVLKKGELYMKGKKNQSLKMWTHTNAKRRVQRVFLNLLWKEWRELRGLPIMNPYVQDYLGHTTIITLDQVLKADSIAPAKKVKPLDIPGADESEASENID